MEEVKSKASYVGNVTREYGSKAFTTVSEKLSAVELKEGARELGSKAKGMWERLVVKV
jgi:hypothetical protein